MLINMAWAELQYSLIEIDAAGAILRAVRPGRPMRAADWSNYNNALAVINNFRSAHSFPLNTFQNGLRKRAERIESQPLVAQRVKRLSSIYQKLMRFNWLQLSDMQDIAGCRVVLSSVEHVVQLVESYKQSSLKHKPIDEDDYINKPKLSGYRSYHLIYQYHSDRKTTYNGRKIEIQLRTNLQHAWATAVETVGTFTRQALKSSRGEKEWLRFFALMASDMAIREGTTRVPKTPEQETRLIDEIRHLAQELDVDRRLRAYKNALKAVENPGVQGARYFLLSLNPEAEQVTITGYNSKEFEKAAADYLDTEKSIEDQSPAEAVLVSVDSVAALRRAYPNYFLDTDLFLNEVQQAIL